MSQSIPRARVNDFLESVGLDPAIVSGFSVSPEGVSVEVSVRSLDGKLIAIGNDVMTANAWFDLA